jgi:hypothetical protein
MAGTPRARSGLRARAAVFGVVTILTAYFALWPLVRPRGSYGWGHYRLVDVYLALPLAATSLACASLFVKTPRARDLLQKLGLAAISAVVTLMIADALYVFGVVGMRRAYYWFDVRGIPEASNDRDPVRGFRRKPHLSWAGTGAHAVSYATDDQGFRNPPGVERAEVAFVGDSFTEGGMVEPADTFVQLTGTALRAAVVNLGVGAYSPPQELDVLEKEVPRYHPRIVVWQIYEGNDLYETEWFVQWRAAPGRSQLRLKQFYAARSPLCHVLDATLRPFEPGIALRMPDGSVRPLRKCDSAVANPESQYRLGLDRTLDALRRGASLCRERRQGLVVLLIPTVMRALEPRLVFRDENSRRAVLPPGAQENPLAAALDEACREAGCVFVDALPALRARAIQDPTGITFQDDPHLGVVGNRVVAGELTRVLGPLLRAE